MRDEEKSDFFPIVRSTNDLKLIKLVRLVEGYHSYRLFRQNRPLRILRAANCINSLCLSLFARSQGSTPEGRHLSDHSLVYSSSEN